MLHCCSVYVTGQSMIALTYVDICCAPFSGCLIKILLSTTSHTGNLWGFVVVVVVVLFFAMDG